MDDDNHNSHCNRTDVDKVLDVCDVSHTSLYFHNGSGVYDKNYNGIYNNDGDGGMVYGESVLIVQSHHDSYKTVEMSVLYTSFTPPLYVPTIMYGEGVIDV